MYVSQRRNIAAAQKFLTDVLTAHGQPAEVTTDPAAPLLQAIDELIPDAVHDTEQHTDNRIETDHGRLKARLQPIHGRVCEQFCDQVLCVVAVLAGGVGSTRVRIVCDYFVTISVVGVDRDVVRVWAMSWSAVLLIAGARPSCSAAGVA